MKQSKLNKHLKDLKTLKNIIASNAEAHKKALEDNEKLIEEQHPGLIADLKRMSKNKDLKGLSDLMKNLKEKEKQEAQNNNKKPK